ncbi:MAG: hypothetical protein PHV30_11310 [Candidatus Margulisbacteria bacterium]|nr:hypothetical protein [Candidatus Margulisiibacteriota bacterium]
MDQKRWNSYEKSQQILMIGSEFGRAKTWIIKKAVSESIQCYYRALDLIEQTVDDPKWNKAGRELLRFKEMVAEAALFKTLDLQNTLLLYRTLLGWNAKTEKVQI